MKQIRDSYRQTGRLHHAYALVGDRVEIKDQLFTFLEQDLKFPLKGNPDFWLGESQVLKIKDSQEINKVQQKKAVAGERKIFIIFANFITKDAQNSLLKMCEEPSINTTFFLVLSSAVDLLPTLKSRLMIVEVGSGVMKNKNLNALEFLEAKVGARLNMVNKILKDIKDEKVNKADIIVFLKDLERVLRNQGKLQSGEDLEKAISYANDESPSLKVILEHLAITL